MKKYRIPILVVIISLLGMARSVRAPKETTDFQLNEFGRLPTLLGGRIQPIDSMARNSLLQIAGKHSISGKLYEASESEQSDADDLSALQWLVEVATDPETADRRYLFRMHHPEVIGALGLEGKGIAKSGLRWYPYALIRDQRPAIVTEYGAASRIESELRTHQQRQYVELGSALSLYERLKNTFATEDSDNFRKEVDESLALVSTARDEMQKQQAGEPFDQAVLDRLNQDLDRYFAGAGLAVSRPIPPEPAAGPSAGWSNIHTNIIDSFQTQTLREPVAQYAEMVSGLQTDDPERFNRAVTNYGSYLEENYPERAKKAESEFFYNHLKPFGNATVYYILALVITAVYWLMPSKEVLRRIAFGWVLLALVIHSFGIFYRMWLEGRPPVTNLYSSAVFVGWGAVVLGVILEALFKRGIGIVVSAVIGFLTLRIAYALSLDGDTMEMLQAVLDTNAWLATHVVIITIGYSATFLAGFLALVYFILGIFTKSLDREVANQMTKMVYGIVCFATLFSFVGTILGGIWADQSWGRFWGWDPKENGALLIVLWNAVILHARWGGFAKGRSLMALAVFGNVVTAFSWFGVNLLGVGLHSYGFMEGSFKWLTIFCLSQVAIIALGSGLPMKYWMSSPKAK